MIYPTIKIYDNEFSIIGTPDMESAFSLFEALTDAFITQYYNGYEDAIEDGGEIIE